MLLAEDESIAYGKFFNKNAGFVSKSFFPVFANYRRNGYDFDALFEDELASYRSKKIMDVFACDEEGVGKELMSYEAKALAGFGKKADGQAGEKNFDGVLTDLQMQTYLIMSRFAQKKNRKGQAYGWHIAAIETPETKWGRAAVTASYKDDPARSWMQIVERVKTFFPEAADEQIQKLLGIRYPGTEKKEPKRNTGKKAARNSIPRKSLPWPESLITEIGLDLLFDEGEYKALTKDQMEGLRYVLENLQERERAVLKFRYEEHRTLKETAAVFGLSTERIRQITAHALNKLRHPTRVRYYRDGYIGCQLMEEEKRKAVINQEERTGQIKALKDFNISNCDLSVRAMNCLARSNIHTLGEIVELMDTDPKDFVKIRNLGKQSQFEILDKLEEYGVDCTRIRSYIESGEAYRSPEIVSLRLSGWLPHILIGNGIDTVEELIKVIREDPDKLMKIKGFEEPMRDEIIKKLAKAGIDIRDVSKG